MNTTKLQIPSNGNNLFARLETPSKGRMNHLAIFAHCFTCTSDLGIVRNISRALTSKGIGVLRFDFTGLGRSDGEFENSNFSKNVTDIQNVYQYLSQNYIKPDLLIGHSLGGAAVLMASKDLNVRAIATIGAPAEPIHVKHLFSENIDEIKKEGEALVNIGGRPFMVKKQFIDDLSKNNLLNIIGGLKIPLLIMHSPQDKTVEIENAAKLYKAAFHPKSFVSLDGADHLLSSKEDGLYVANILATWSSRYLPKVIEEKISTEGHQAVAKLALEDGFSTDIHAGDHYILADEPKAAGGADLGPSPYDLLNASLGACTVMTLKLYAERKKWDLKEVYVYLSHKKVLPNELGIVTSQPNKRIDVFEKNLKFVGNLDQEQKEKLKEIASKCPVHRSLTSDIEIVTKIIHE